MSLLRMLFGRKVAPPDRSDPTAAHGRQPASRDTVAAISELSQVVRNNPDAVEIYLALGNLYRSQGEIERAVQIRNNLIVRPGLDTRFKARAWYELGRDYKRGGFVDRALRAFEEAGNLWGDNEAIVSELALLCAESGEYDRAARHYEKLGNRVAEAHYQVRLAQAAYAKGEDGAGKRWLSKALKVHPGSVEAWLARIEQAYQSEEWDAIGLLLADAMDHIRPDLRFLLMEGVLTVVRGSDLDQLTTLPSARREQAAPSGAPSEEDTDQTPRSPEDDALCSKVLPVLEKQPQDLLLEYYGAWIHMLCGDVANAKAWLEKTLVLKPDFWPARLELLALSRFDQPLTPVFKVQLEFFIAQARQVKRFVCKNCGLKREQIFFTCPRCHSWHSIAFRAVLND